jgi:hypothetical protein
VKDVHCLCETRCAYGQAKDGDNKNFKVPSAREKAKKVEVPKVRREEEDLQSHG